MDDVKFEICPQDNVGTYSLGVEAVLGILNHPEAMVTDESEIRDFTMGLPEIFELAVLDKLSKEFGFPVQRTSRVWKLAKWWEEKENGR